MRPIPDRLVPDPRFAKPRERGWNVRMQDRNPEEAARKPIYLAIGAIGIVVAAVLMARRLLRD